MSRESVGTFRMHRFTCDQCGREVEHRSKGTGPIPMPPGWGHLRLQLDIGPLQEADVCSPKCAGEWTQAQIRAGDDGAHEAAS